MLISMETLRAGTGNGHATGWTGFHSALDQET